MVHPVWYKWEN